VVPNAAVTIKNNQTERRGKQPRMRPESIELPLLPPGSYELKIKGGEFRVGRATLVLSVGQS
jgi:hypothetical protein